MKHVFSFFEKIRFNYSLTSTFGLWEREKSGCIFLQNKFRIYFYKKVVKMLSEKKSFFMNVKGGLSGGWPNNF